MIQKTHYNGLPVKIKLMNVQEIPLHNQDDLQLLVVLKGWVDLFLAVQTYHVSEGQIHFIHVQDIHGIKGNGDNLVLLVNIDLEFAQIKYPGIKYECFTTRFEEDTLANQNENTILTSCIYEVVNSFFSEDKYADEKSRYYALTQNVNALLDVLNKYFRTFQCPNIDAGFQYNPYKDRIQVDRISRVISQVYMRFEEKLNLSEIAEKEHVSKFYLSHLFQQYTGLAFRDFVSMVRVEKALRSMLSSDLSLSKISFNVGFSHYSFFKKNFEKWYGESPQEFRDKNKYETIDHKRPVFQELDYEQVKDAVGQHLNSVTLLPNQPAESEIKLDELIYEKDIVPQVKLRVPHRTTSSDEPEFVTRYVLGGLYPDQGKELSALIKKGVIEIDREKGPERGAASKVGDEDGRKVFENYDFNKCFENILSLDKETVFTLYDDNWEGKGLLFRNGLLSPSYYIFYHMIRLYDEQVILDDGIISKQGDKYRIILVNNNRDHKKEEVLHLSNGKRYKGRLEYITPQSSSVWIWSRINYIELSEEDIREINEMTKPRKELFLIDAGKREKKIILPPSTVCVLWLSERMP